MSNRASSSLPPPSPSPYTTRAGRVVKPPVRLHSNESLVNRTVSAPTKSVEKVAEVEGRKKEDDEPEEDVESEEDDELEDEIEYNPWFNGNDDWIGVSSDESSYGNCVGCGAPGPRGCLCREDGCEDSNFIYE